MKTLVFSGVKASWL